MLSKLRYAQWVLTYLPGLGPEDLLDDPEDNCAAAVSARRLNSKQAKTARLMESHPNFQLILAPQARWLSRMGMGVGEAADASLRMNFALALAAAKKHAPAPRGVAVDHIHPVFLDYEDTFALTKTYPDGSALVRVTNAIMTSCQLVAAVNKVALRYDRWPSRGARRSEVVLPAVAALRFYLIHQRALGISAKVLPTGTGRKQLDDLDTLPILFLFAHELGHHWLQHGVGDPAAHQLELDADRFAHRLLTAMIGDSDRSGLADAAATIALLGIELDQRGRFIRGPETHPSLPARVGHIQGKVKPELGPRLIPFLPDLVLAACRRDSLPEVYWPALTASRDWNTSIHPDNHVEGVQALDATASLSLDRGRDGVATVTGRVDSVIADGLTLLERGDPAGACTAWGVDPTTLLQDRAALSFFTVVETLTECETFVDAGNGYAINTVLLAVLCTHRLLPFLAPPEP